MPFEHYYFPRTRCLATLFQRHPLQSAKVAEPTRRWSVSSSLATKSKRDPFSLVPDLPRLGPRDAKKQRLRAAAEMKKHNDCTSTNANTEPSFPPLHSYPPSQFPVQLRNQDINRFLERDSARAREEQRQQQQAAADATRERQQKQYHQLLRSPLKQITTVVREIQKQRNLEEYKETISYGAKQGSHMKQRQSPEDVTSEPILEDLCVPDPIEHPPGQQWTPDPYRVRWSLYCHISEHWQQTLAQYFPHLSGLGTKVDRCVYWVWLGMIGLYGIQALTCTIYYKFSMILRYQALFTASALAYTAGRVWGYGLGSRRSPQSGRACAHLACWMLCTGLFGLMAVGYDRNIGYLSLNAAAATSTLWLSWCHRLRRLPPWITGQATTILLACIACNIVGQLQATRLERTAQQTLLNADLSDKLSIISLLKAYAPQSLVQTLFTESLDHDDFTQAIKPLS